MCWEMSGPWCSKNKNITFSCHLKVGDLTFMTHSIASVWWDVVCLMFEALGWNQFGLVFHPSPLANDTEVTENTPQSFWTGLSVPSLTWLSCVQALAAKQNRFLGQGGNHFTSHSLDLPLELTCTTILTETAS